MTTEILGARTGDFLLGDPSTISYEYVTVASGQVLDAGTVLGKITVSGKYAAYDNTAVDGTQVAVCVLLDNCDASGGDQAAAAVSRLAEVQTDKLVWHANNDAAAKLAGIADMASAFVIAR